jgi:hypothetical protein
MRRRRKSSRTAQRTTRACFMRLTCSRAPRVQGARYTAFGATAAAALLHYCCVATALLIRCLLALRYLMLLLLQKRRGQLRSGSSLVLIASQLGTYQCSAIISGSTYSRARTRLNRQRHQWAPAQKMSWQRISSLPFQLTCEE